jgi:carbon-monoxide dehydrogenase medium subunit
MATVLSPDLAGFKAVHSLPEAHAVLDELGEETQILAGGTDVMVQLLRGDISPTQLLHIGRIAELAAHVVDQSRVHLGALVTHRHVVGEQALAEALPALSEACATVGGWQTQEVGTVVGNVCNASPAADTLPPLLVADTMVHLSSSRGDRAVPLDEFVLDRRSTSARPDEIVASLESAVCAPGSGEAYLKVAPRTAMEVALVGLAVRLRFQDGSLADARIAAGAVAPRPFRVPEAEAVLVESALSGQGVAQAAALVVARSDPIDDARASASYRRRVLGGLLARAVAVARRRATEPSG